MTTRALTLPAAALIAGLALSACTGTEEKNAGTPTASSVTPETTAPSAAPEESEPNGPALTVTIAGSNVGPNAQQVTVRPGEPMTISFDTDRPGELHVHSKPEQYVQFDAGRSTKQLVIGAPGNVEIEEHESEAVVAIVQVR